MPLWKPELDKAAAIRFAVDTGSAPPESRRRRFSSRDRLLAIVATAGMSMLGLLAMQTLGGPAVGLGSAAAPDTPQRVAEKPAAPGSGDARASAPNKPKRASTPKRPAAEAAPALAGIRLSPADEAVDEVLVPAASAQPGPAIATEQRSAEPAAEGPSRKAARAKGHNAELGRPQASSKLEATKVEPAMEVRLSPPRLAGRTAPVASRKPLLTAVKAPQAQVAPAFARAFPARDLDRHPRYATYPSPPSIGVAY